MSQFRNRATLDRSVPVRDDCDYLRMTFEQVLEAMFFVNFLVVLIALAIAFWR